ncbi:MAG: ATP-binding protein [Planctomycetota bacterium JB042]
MISPDPYMQELCRRWPAVVVDASGVVTAVGDAAPVALDLDPSVVVGRSFDEVFPPLPDAGADVRGVVGPTGALSARRVRTVRVPGGGDDPSEVRTLVLLHEVTDLLRARAECLNLTRLASAGRLISGIVHEINNPLSGIIGYSQLLLMRELERDVRSQVEKVYGEAIRTSRIVRNLLDFSRRRPSKPGRVELWKVLRKALDLKSHDLRVKNVSVNVGIPEDLPAVHGEAHQLLQVFVNLIGNSEQAMYAADHGGRITIEASAAEETVSLLLRDTGPGVPEDLRERIFEPFFTTKDEGQGTGLGLALCREILRQQQAAIQLMETEAGASFLMTFKVYRSAAKPRPARRAKKAARVRGRRIMVVEDDPVCRSLLREAFERTGNAVTAFDRSDAALRFLGRNSVDVIVSDLHRPGLNGIEFHDRVARFDPGLARRVVFLTGDTLNDELARFLREHGNPFVPKPVELADLFEKVHDLLEGVSARQKTLFSTAPEPREGEAP